MISEICRRSREEEKCEKLRVSSVYSWYPKVFLGTFSAPANDTQLIKVSF